MEPDWVFSDLPAGAGAAKFGELLAPDPLPEVPGTDPFFAPAGESHGGLTLASRDRSALRERLARLAPLLSGSRFGPSPAEGEAAVPLAELRAAELSQRRSADSAWGRSCPVSVDDLRRIESLRARADLAWMDLACPSPEAGGEPEGFAEGGGSAFWRSARRFADLVGERLVVEEAAVGFGPGPGEA